MTTRHGIAVGAVTVAATITIAIVANSSPTGRDIPVLLIERGPYLERVTADGALRAVNSTELQLSPDLVREPPTLAWLIPDGSHVEAGELVARFDGTAYRRDLDDGVDNADIASAKIERAEAAAGGTLANLERDAALSRSELDLAERFQATDDDLYSRHEILSSAIDTELARSRTEQTALERPIQERLSGADVELLDIERRQAELQESQARDGLRRLELRAPHAGIVVLGRRGGGRVLEVGDVVYWNRPVATIPDLSEMEVEVYVLEADAGALAIGQRASVVIEAHPEKSYEAVVRSVDPVAQPRRRRSPVQYFRTVLELAHTDLEIMKPGQAARAEIRIADHDDAVAVPRQAVVDLDGRIVVYRRRGRGFEPVEVTVGSAGVTRVVIASGLEEGDLIALRDPTRSAGGPPDRATAAGAPIPGNRP